MRVITIVIVSLGLFVAATAVGNDVKEDERAIEGIWSVEKAELAGKRFPEQVIEVMSVTFQGGKYRSRLGQQEDVGTYQLHRNTDAKAIDVVIIEGENKGKTFLGIYEFQEDVLSICYDLGGRHRPTEFKTDNNPQRFLATYRRKKSSD